MTAPYGVCGVRVKLTPDRIGRARALRADVPSQVLPVVQCSRQIHHRTDPHYGIARQLPSTYPDVAIWVAWYPREQPHAVMERTYCTTAGPEPCGLYAGHPHGHTWELSSPGPNRARNGQTSTPHERTSAMPDPQGPVEKDGTKPKPQRLI
jgi:hypothetical protein